MSQLSVAKSLSTEYAFTASRESIEDFVSSKLFSDLKRLFTERAIVYKLQIADSEIVDIHEIDKLRGYANAQADTADLLDNLLALYDTVKEDETAGDKPQKE